jgi:hypothetical protein
MFLDNRERKSNFSWPMHFHFAKTGKLLMAERKREREKKSLFCPKILSSD